HGTGGSAVDGTDIGAARAQGRQVNTYTAAACHNLGHNFQVVEDTLAAVFRAGYNVAVVKCYLVAGTCSGQNTTTWHKLKVRQRLVKMLLPVGLLLFCRLHSGN